MLLEGGETAESSPGGLWAAKKSMNISNDMISYIW